MFEVARDTGNVRPGTPSAVSFIEGESSDLRTFVWGNGTAPNPGSPFGIGGYLFGGESGDTVQLGNNTTVSPPVNAAILARYSATGVPDWARTMLRPDQNLSPRPTALTPTDDRQLIAAMYANAAGAQDATFEISTSGQPVSVTLSGRDNLLLAFDDGGDVNWTYRIPSNTERTIYRLLPTPDALYALGLGGPGVAFEQGTPNQIRLDGRAPYVAKHRLQDGALQWVQQLGLNPNGLVFAERPSLLGEHLVVPVRMTEADVTRDADPVRVRTQSTNLSLVALRYASDTGDFVDCTEVVAGTNEVLLY